MRGGMRALLDAATKRSEEADRDWSRTPYSEPPRGSIVKAMPVASKKFVERPCIDEVAVMTASDIKKLHDESLKRTIDMAGLGDKLVMVSTETHRDDVWVPGTDWSPHSADAKVDEFGDIIAPSTGRHGGTVTRSDVADALRFGVEGSERAAREKYEGHSETAPTPFLPTQCEHCGTW